MIETRIQILITHADENGSFKDALYFTQEEYEKRDPSEIEALAQARIDAHVERARNPPQDAEPTKEAVEAELAELDARKSELTQKLTEIESKVRR